MVHAIYFNVDSSVKGELKNLATLQTRHSATSHKARANDSPHLENKIRYKQCPVLQRGQTGQKLEGYVAGMPRAEGYAICTYIVGAFRK